MARGPDALEFRRWALDYSPSVLKRKAIRQWERVSPGFGKMASPFFLERWRAGLFGEETDKERQQYDNEFKNGILRGTLIEESLFVASWAEKLSESLGVPVVCDRAPYEVPAGHAHLFDILPSTIRRSMDAAISESEMVGIRAAIHMLREESPPNLYEALTSMRPIMDRAIPALLRASDGFGIHTEFVRHWIVFNVRSARYAVDPRHKQASYQSIAKITSALLPSEWAAMGPNEAGIALEYRIIRERADSILRKKYRNVQLKRADLQKALPQIARPLVDRSADQTPKNFALEILSTEHGLKKSYVWNLVRRGNLQIDIAAHWHEALLSSASTQPSTNPPSDLSPCEVS